MSTIDHKACFKARFGTPKMQDEAMHHPDSFVRKQVAEHGDKAHLDWLVHDKAANVLTNVAKRGHKEHLDKLVNHPHAFVRAAVAETGGPEHHDVLSHDNDDSVREHVAAHATESSHHERLANVKSQYVRGALALNPHISDDLLQRLKGDTHPFVRRNAKDAWNGRHAPDAWHPEE